MFSNQFSFSLFILGASSQSTLTLLSGNDWTILAFFPSLCIRTRFQLLLPVHSHNVTKNMTGHRMHVEGPQIYHINRQTNSFQNMCDMLQAKIDRLTRKIDFVQKNTSKQFFCVCTDLGYLTLAGPGRQTVYTRSTSGHII